MGTNNTSATIAFILAAIMLALAVYIHYFGEDTTMLIANPSVCDNTLRINPDSMQVDKCEIIDSATAQKLFDNYKIDTIVTEPWGAWIGKELIDTMFTGNDFNGISIVLGKDPNTHATCFIIKAGKENYRTIPPKPEANSYFRLDAMCPTFCDGLNPERR